MGRRESTDKYIQVSKYDIADIVTGILSFADLDRFFLSGCVFFIRILDMFPNPDPDPGQKHIFSKAIAKFWEKF